MEEEIPTPYLYSIHIFSIKKEKKQLKHFSKQKWRSMCPCMEHPFPVAAHTHLIDLALIEYSAHLQGVKLIVSIGEIT